jgi:signal transduction histidine kinase
MKSPTPRLVAGLVVTLMVIGAYAAYTLHTVSRMRQVQADIVERNRRGSLQLIRIQNDLNALALALRDILENAENYPLSAWQAPLGRIRENLDDAIRREGEMAVSRAPEQTSYLRASLADFWGACDVMLARAAAGDEAGARQLVRTTLQPRQEALSALTARLLVEKNNEESRGGEQVNEIFHGIETNAYRFLGASIMLVVVISVGVIRANRRLFTTVAELAEQRRELARQLISTQESTFRAISRDLHDEFGQILTALGVMLRRAAREAPDSRFHEQLQEASRTVQATLDGIRALSHSLQPVILEEQGLLAAIAWHVGMFERQTGIRVDYHAPPTAMAAGGGAAIHVYRILQESLNNVARHAGVDRVEVRVEIDAADFELVVEDNSPGTVHPLRAGVGLTAMRERAELVGGRLNIGPAGEAGTRVTLRVPRAAIEEAAVA